MPSDLLFTDLEIPVDPDASLPITPSGDVRLVSGRPNLRGALRRRLASSPGELTHRPDYGCGVVAHVEEVSTPAARALLANDARRNLLRDPRLADARIAVRATDDPTRPDAVTVSLAVALQREPDDETLVVTLPR